MPDSREYLLELLKDLIDHGVQFVVCGGVAAVLHGVERLTIDLDLSLLLNAENLQNFLAVMKRQNMVPRAPIAAESILDRDIRAAMVEQKGATVFTFIDPDNAYKQIDFFLSPDKSYESLIGDTLKIELEDGYSLQILTIDKLIEMKRSVSPPRDKDRFDIEALGHLKEKHR